MSSTIEQLTRRKLINPPNDVKSNTMYETVVGSIAYGVSDDLSDFDVNGFYIPAAHKLFPTLRGHLLGFDADPKAPKAFQQHHIDDQDGRRMWDLNIYSITIYFKLCLENNPNMVDTLYTPRDCVLHSTTIAEMVREKRDLFLHKRCWPKYKGYAYQQLHKMKGKDPEEGSKRWQLRERYGYDVKFAYHLVRLLYEAEMIAAEGTIDIRRNREHLKAIRRGDVTQAEVETWAAEKESHLERLFETTTLRAEPARAEIKQLLINCLEHHYGNLSELAVVRAVSSTAEDTLDKIRELLDIPTIQCKL